MKKRVVITGMGVVSPNSIGNEAFCRAVLAGSSGVKRIRSFDPSNLPVQIAGEVQDFDELAWVDAHERKHVSRVVPLALAASTEALTDAGIDTGKLSLEQQREIGVVLGSGGGAQEFSEEQVRLWLTGKVKQVSLFCIPSGTMGTLSSEVSMRFGLRGMSHVITTGCTSSTDAFGYALRQIQFGFLPVMTWLMPRRPKRMLTSLESVPMVPLGMQNRLTCLTLPVSHSRTCSSENSCAPPPEPSTTPISRCCSSESFVGSMPAAAKASVDAASAS